MREALLPLKHNPCSGQDHYEQMGLHALISYEAGSAIHTMKFHFLLANSKVYNMQQVLVRALCALHF